MPQRISTRSSRISTILRLWNGSRETNSWNNYGSEQPHVWKELEEATGDVGVPQMNLPFYFFKDKDYGDINLYGLDNPPFVIDPETKEAHLDWKLRVDQLNQSRKLARLWIKTCTREHLGDVWQRQKIKAKKRTSLICSHVWWYQATRLVVRGRWRSLPAFGRYRDRNKKKSHKLKENKIMNKINWSVRLKNKNFWLAVVPALHYSSSICKYLRN